MMHSTATPHNFLLFLRIRAPHLARRLDRIRSLKLGKGVLTVGVPRGGWTTSELQRVHAEMEKAVRLFFGDGTRLNVELTRAAPQALPFPVTSSKHWNHVVFLASHGAGVCAVALPKPTYLDQWPEEDTAGEGVPDWQRSAAPGVHRFHYRRNGDGLEAESALAAALPDLLDDLAALARNARSYAQIVLAFPGDPEAQHLESLLYAVKEWGTPRTPGPVLAKYVGRIHYLAPETRCHGVGAAKRAAAAVEG